MKNIKILGLIACLAFSINVLAKCKKTNPEPAFIGTVVSVQDGDTFRIKYENSPLKLKIRLHAIDAPEKGETGWRKSKEHLAQLISGKKLEFYCVYSDSYGRKVCKVLMPNTLKDIGLSMVLAKFAKIHPKYFCELSPLDQELYSNLKYSNKI